MRTQEGDVRYAQKNEKMLKNISNFAKALVLVSPLFVFNK